MDEMRLKRLGEELSKARKRREEWDAKVRDLERRYKEAENTCIHDMVHAANLTPEQLAELIRAAASGVPYVLPDQNPASAESGNGAGTEDTDSYFDDEEEKEDILR